LLAGESKGFTGRPKFGGDKGGDVGSNLVTSDTSVGFLRVDVIVKEGLVSFQATEGVVVKVQGIA